VLHYNPIERVKRRKIGAKDAARHLTASQVKKGLQQIDRSTAEGLRDYTLLSLALSTGRRSSELAGLRYKHLQRLSNRCHVTWPRCKGDKQMGKIPLKRRPPRRCMPTYSMSRCMVTSCSHSQEMRPYGYRSLSRTAARPLARAQ
jgi:integrase